jgi:predicted RNA-binding protein YlqC (UPF0109 family)
MDTATLSQYVSELLHKLVEGLLDEPGAARIEFISSERTISASITTVPSDRGKLIGQQGRNVMAVRTLCSAICARYRCRFYLTVIEPENEKRRTRDTGSVPG